MTETINIVLCSHLQNEINHIQNKEKEFTFRPFFFKPRCIRPYKDGPSFWDQFGEQAVQLQRRPTIIIGGSCLGNVFPRRDQSAGKLIFDSCIYLFMEEEDIHPLARRGTYSVTPGWLRNWKYNLAQWGFSQEQARLFFHDTVTEIELIDTGVAPGTEHALEEFCSYITLPGKTRFVGVSRLHLLLFKEAYRLGKEGNWKSSIDAAGYQAALDVIQELTGLETEEKIIQRILDFYAMILAPAGIIYISKNSGSEESRVYTWGDAPEEDIDRSRDMKKLYAVDEEQTGFSVSITFRDESVGTLRVIKTAFPEYLRQYLNFCLALNGSLAMVINIARDRKKLRQLNKDLETALEKGKQANKAKNQFIANTSHEIRTPIHGILGMVSLLATEGLTEEQRELVNNINASAHILKDLINDIIDISKIEAGKMELVNSVFNLPKLINDTYSVFLTSAKGSGIALRLENNSPLPEWVKGDFRKLRQVLFNLVSNAIKFTEEGVVTISAAGKHKAEEYVLTIAVQDTGVGIPREKQHLLFQTFSQLDSSETRRSAGSGLGLAISKELVELMGGGIGFAGTEGKGSRFYFTVPLKETDKPPPSQGEPVEYVPRSAEKDGGGVSILVAEDNKINRLTISKILSKNGFQATIAVNGLEAVDECRARKYDLILMDCYMPELDGFSAARQIRELGGWREKVPIIAVTASALKGDIDRCERNGMNDHIEKPFEPKALVAIIEKWLSYN